MNIGQVCGVFLACACVYTWYVVYADSLLEVLVVRDHLGKQRTLHNTHSWRLFLHIWLRDRTKHEATNCLPLTCLYECTI